MSRHRPGARRGHAPPSVAAGRAGPGFLRFPAVAVVLAGGLALLAWTTRGALPGVPVADDYDFLARVRLFPRIDLFDSGGFPFYWRPLTRQLYYAALGDVMLATPWLVASLHGATFLALAFLLHRIARRNLPPLAATCFALLPLVAESARLLLVWPTCGQPLFGTTFAAAAVYAALTGHARLAGVAMLAGLLSYEQTMWALPVVALALHQHEGTNAARIRRLLPVGVALVAWMAGLVVARAHGVRWPVGDVRPDAGAAVGMVGPVLANVDLVAAPHAGMLLIAQLVVLAVAVAWIFLAEERSPASREMARAMPSGFVLAGCATLGLLGLAPALIAPDLWAPRHAFLPSLLLGYAAIAVCARAGPVFAPALLGARVAALLLAPVASAMVGEAPLGGARTTFPELVRLQRIVDSAHHVLADAPRSVPGAAYWAMPLRSGIAFAGEKAPRVWTGNPDFRWTWFERPERSAAQVGCPVLCFDPDVTDPARLVDSLVVEDYFFAVVGSTQVSELERVDSLLEAASRRNGPRPGQVLDELERTRASFAAMQGRLALAESLVATSEARYGLKADHVAIEGWIALQRGNLPEARRLVALCLANEPDHPTGQALLAALDEQGSGQE